MKLNEDCTYSQKSNVDFYKMPDSQIDDYIMCHYNDLIRNCKRCQNEESRKIIDAAFKLANQAHRGMKRKSGEPYIIHPIAVAKIAATEIGLGTKAVAAALLHDVVEDTEYTSEDIEASFGEKIAYLVKGLTKLEEIQIRNAQNELFNSENNNKNGKPTSQAQSQKGSKQAEYFRNLIFTISQDIRVVFLKIADRLHNLRTMEGMPRASQLRSAAETLEIYAPLAHRLGLYLIKSEMEDLAFKYRDPDKYDELKKKIDAKYKNRESLLNRQAIRISNELLNTNWISKDDLEISSRPKTIYSIAQKMEKQGVDFDHVFDKLALRIVFDPQTEDNDIIYQQCWSIMGLIYRLYEAVPNRQRDWIRTPKQNGYRALHTTVMTQTGNKLEIQIRTKKMDLIAEKGLASHMIYKGLDPNYKELDLLIEQVKEEIENPNSDPIDFLDRFKIELNTPDIYVFTPKGELIILKNGSTALDFAFKIHSNLGLSAVAAKIDKDLVSINHPLSTGDQVQILKSKKIQVKREWMDFVISSKAKNAIENYFKNLDIKSAESGKKQLIDLIDSTKYKNNDFNEIEKSLLSYFESKNEQEFYLAIESKKLKKSAIIIGLKKIFDTKNTKPVPEPNPEANPETNPNPNPTNPQNGNGISSLNPKETHRVGDNIDYSSYTIAECCSPIPGEEVTGFIDSDSNKIIIHRTTCPKAIALNSKHKSKMIPLKWTPSRNLLPHAKILVKGKDSKGILLKMLQVISNEMNVNMNRLDIYSKLGIFEGEIGLYISDLKHLNILLQKIMQVNGVISVRRKTASKEFR